MFISILITFSNAYTKEYAGSGKGSNSCTNFIIETLPNIKEFKSLSTDAFISRIEYIEWAKGFITALNIRQYERFGQFKNLDSISNSTR